VDGGSWKGDVPAAYEPMSMVIGRLPGKDLAELTGCPRYTTSLDAAMGLVPEGWAIDARRYSDGWYVAIAGLNSTLIPTSKFRGSQKPAAIALCIAALKALRARVQP